MVKRNVTLGNATLGNVSLGNVTLGNVTLGNVYSQNKQKFGGMKILVLTSFTI